MTRRELFRRLFRTAFDTLVEVLKSRIVIATIVVGAAISVSSTIAAYACENSGGNDEIVVAQKDNSIRKVDTVVVTIVDTLRVVDTLHIETTMHTIDTVEVMRYISRVVEASENPAYNYWRN